MKRTIRLILLFLALWPAFAIAQAHPHLVAVGFDLAADAPPDAIFADDAALDGGTHRQFAGRGRRLQGVPLRSKLVQAAVVAAEEARAPARAAQFGVRVLQRCMQA